MNLKQIEEIQKENAERELSGWLAIINKEVIAKANNAYDENSLARDISNVERVKSTLFILSQTSKALRRHGHFLGLDKEGPGPE